MVRLPMGCTIWQRSFDRARSIPVVENDLTREFLKARQVTRWNTDLYNWKYYKTLQRQRHRMAEYCRSNLDWVWEPSSFLKRLFRIDRPQASSRPEGAVQQRVTGVPPIHRGINGDTLNVSIPDKAPSILEKVVRIRYETEAGDVRYKTFYAGPSVEDIASGTDAGQLEGPWLSLAQETDIGLLTGALNEDGEAPRDEMRNIEVADEVHEEVWSSRKLNGASDTEDDNASIDSTDTERPQHNSRIEEWLETQVSAQMAD